MSLPMCSSDPLNGPYPPTPPDDDEDEEEDDWPELGESKDTADMATTRLVVSPELVPR